MPLRIPDSALWFRPDIGNAPGLADGAGFKISLSFDQDGTISKGAYSTLYEASVLTTQGLRRVAVKVFDDETRRDDALLEYQILKKLDGLDGHLPRAVALGDARHLGVYSGGFPAIAQEYVAGTSVREIGSSLNGHAVTADEHHKIVLQMSWAIVSAVSAISSRGVCHGDLSYTNVLIAWLTWKNGFDINDYNAVVIDLGQAAIKTNPSTYGKPGTVFFAAPEISDSTNSFAAARTSSDVYSVGALMAYLLKRRDYPDDRSLVEAYRDARREGWSEVLRWVTPEPGNDPELASTIGMIVAACLREDPLERPGLADLNEDLRTLCKFWVRTSETMAYIRDSVNVAHITPAMR